MAVEVPSAERRGTEHSFGEVSLKKKPESYFTLKSKDIKKASIQWHFFITNFPLSNYNAFTLHLHVVI